MKRIFKSVLCIMVLCLEGCRLFSLPPQKPFYSPRQIDDLISSDTAVPHGAQFENQGLGCSTFLLRESDNKHIFFFTRNGKSLGEYREETLSDGKFLQIEEMYLTKNARSTDFLKGKRELPFIRKATTLHRDNNIWVGSTIHWALLLRARNGTLMKYLKQDVEEISKSSIRIVVPSKLMAKDKEYYLAAYRQNPSDFDKAFYRITERNGLQLQWAKVINGECEMKIECSAQRPELLFELHERIPNLPHDATPFMVRTKSILSMKLSSGVTQEETINFEQN